MILIRFGIVVVLVTSACTSVPKKTPRDHMPVQQKIEKNLEAQGIYWNTKKSKRRVAIEELVAAHNAEVDKDEAIECEFRKVVGSHRLRFVCSDAGDDFYLPRGRFVPGP